jgi:putative nucleotidyltransferase with HDIG domain
VLGEIGEIVETGKLLEKCIGDKKTVVAVDVLLEKRGIRGDKIIIPLYVFGELTGIVYLETGSSNSFLNVDVKFFENIAIYIAVIITNTEMFNSIYMQKQEIESLYQQTTAANKALNSYLNELAKAKEELKIKNSALTKFYNEIQTGYLQTVMALANSIEAKDPYTRGHCQRVMEISCEMAKRMGFSDDEIEDLRYAAILHDIGKIGVSASIINKEEKLSDEEYHEIKKHPLIAYNILKEVEFIKKGLNAILEHHERYDGKGYPYGIKADCISKFGRILCVADAFDAMTTDRPYKKGMKMNRAIKEIEKCKGTHFDPVIADIFIEMSKQIISDIDEVSISATVQVE